MRTSSLILAASVVASGLTFGSAFSGEAQAGPLVQSTPQMAKLVKLEDTQLIRTKSRARGFRSRGGSRMRSPGFGGGRGTESERPRTPSSNIASDSGNIGGGRSPSSTSLPNGGGRPTGPGVTKLPGMTSQPNPNRPDLNASNGKKAGKKFRFHFRVHGGRRDWCHRHYYKVRGMRFHSRVRCDHRHYRAYRSWDFVY